MAQGDHIALPQGISPTKGSQHPDAHPDPAKKLRRDPVLEDPVHVGDRKVDDHIRIDRSRLLLSRPRRPVLCFQILRLPFFPSSGLYSGLFSIYLAATLKSAMELAPLKRTQSPSCKA